MRLIKQHYLNLLGFGLIFGLLLLAYAPVLQIPFVFNDDFLLFSNPINSCSDHPLFGYFFLIGRLAVPLADCPFWLFIDSIRDLTFARFINISALSISAFIFFKWLTQNRFSWPQSLLVTVIVFISPTFQPQVALAHSFCHMVAFLLTLFCGIYVCRWLKEENGKYIVLATVFFFLALNIHPCVAMFIWPVLFIFVYNHNPGSRKLFHVLLWFFAVCLFYFFFVRFMSFFVPHFFNVTRDLLGEHEAALVESISTSWYKFRYLCLAALNLWAVVPRAWIVFGALSLFLTAVAIKSVQCIQSQKQCSIVRNGFLLLTIPLSLLPILSAQYNALSYRMISGLTAIVIMLLFLSLRRILLFLPFERLRSPVLTFMLMLLAIIYIGQARFNQTFYLAAPANKELEYVKDYLKDLNISQIDTIHVIRPQHPNWLHRRPFGGDEFGLLSSSISQNIRGLVRCAMKEMTFDDEDIDKIQITTGPFNEQPDSATRATTLIIDMNEKTNHYFWH